MAQKTHIIHLLKLRIAVGLLGELQSPTWWPSAFFSRTSPAFLKHTFGRTMTLAQYHGVCEAATRVHDDHIGIGTEVFHLFRLPERLERNLHELWRDADIVREVSEQTDDQPTAQAYLRQYAHEADVEGVGPVRVGSLTDLDEPTIWQVVAWHYANAFQAGSEVFPYFTNA
jgi:hypothetical protein